MMMKHLRLYLILILCTLLGRVNLFGETYQLVISADDFNTTSYAANNNEKTSTAHSVTDDSKTYEVKWTSNQVMKISSNMQWQKSKGYIYNSTDLGTITSVNITSSAGTFTTYYGTTAQPSTSTTVGGGFFKINVGGATGATSSIEITFTIEGTIGEPTFSPAAGAVASGTTVTLTAGNNATDILYTTDGSTPSYADYMGNGSTQLYENAFTITEPITINAICVDADGHESAMVTAAYSVATTKVFTLVTDASSLAEGDEIIIVNTATSQAMSKTQNTNNRGEAEITITDESVSVPPSSTIQILTLEGDATGWYFNTGDGYLYAASSSANHLRTEAEKDDNAKALISLDNDGNSNITFQGENTRNFLQYNAQSKIFSCYSPGNSNVQIYRHEDNPLSNPELAFSQTAVTWRFGDAALTEPVLSMAEGVPAAVYSSSDNNIAAVDAATGEVTVKAVGTVTIIASTAATTTFRKGTTSYTLTIEKGDANLAYATTEYQKSVNEAFATPTLTNPQGVSVVFSSSDATVAAVDAATGAVTILSKRGVATITATFAGNEYFNAASASYVIKVSDPAINQTSVVGTLFKETFNSTDGTGGNDNTWSGSIASKTITADNTGWSFTQNGGGNGCIKMGTSGNSGRATTPAIDVTNGETYTLTFKAAPWSSESAAMNVSVTGGTVTGLNTTEMTTAQWNNFEATITATSSNIKISFTATKNRFFLDEVVLRGNIITETVRNTVTSAKYSTMYYGSYAVTVPEGAEAYTVKLADGGGLIRSKTYGEGDVVPAGTAVVVHATPNSYDFVLSNEEGEPDTENLLRGSDVASTTTGPDTEKEYKFYMLSLNAEKDPESVGFYFNKDDADGGPFVNGAHKAYLALEKEASAKNFFLFADVEAAEEEPSQPIVEPEPKEDDTVTGIAGVRTAASDSVPQYNLAGQRVQSNYRGIVVRNGKKILMK